jgi:hypothetical protein
MNRFAALDSCEPRGNINNKQPAAPSVEARRVQVRGGEKDCVCVCLHGVEMARYVYAVPGSDRQLVIRFC